MKPILNTNSFVKASGSIFVIFFLTLILFPPMAIGFISFLIYKILKNHFIIFKKSKSLFTICFIIGIFIIFNLIHYVDKIYKFHNNGFINQNMEKRYKSYEYKVDKQPSILFPFIK